MAQIAQMTDLTVEEPWFFFSIESRPALGPPSLLLNGYRGNTDVA
jgi:hypothetical protein